jgi:ABC-type transport system substrate-binding protein
VAGFVSSGPYSLKTWEHNRTMTWDLNPYYNGAHMPGCVKVVNYINLGNSWNAWLDHEIDLIGLGQAELQILRADPKLNPLLQFYPNFQTCFLNMKATEPPLNNIKLRQAIAHAIDRETLAYQLQQGTVSVAYAMLPPGYPAWNEDELKPLQIFNVEQARQLLSEAGYPDGKDSTGKQLKLDLYPNGRQAQLEFIQQQLETNLGLAFNVFPQENTVWRKMRSEKQMMMFYGCCEYDYIDPANLLGTYWRSVDERGSGSYPWTNANFDALLDKASTISDPAERIATYKEAERILVGEVGGVFLTHGLIFQAAWPYIAGIKNDVTGAPNFRGLDISRFQMYIRDDVGNYRKDKP